MKTPPLTAHAQKIWRDDVLTGRCTVEQALRSFCQGVKEDDLSRQIDSMPDQMFAALSQFLTPVSIEGGSMDWSNETLSLSQLELHAFDFDCEKALKWKRHRLEVIYAVIQQRKNKQRDT